MKKREYVEGPSRLLVVWSLKEAMKPERKKPVRPETVCEVLRATRPRRAR